MADLGQSEWLEILHKMTALAQSGLHYSKDIYDKERYQQLIQYVEELLQLQQISTDQFQADILKDIGYATPKIDVRAVIFKDNQLLLVKEVSDGLWSLPGGWADPGYSAAENVIKEVVEETGLEVRCLKLLALTDMRKHPHPPMFLHVYKAFFLCEIICGELKSSIETSAVDFFSFNQLPEISVARVTHAQIEACFNAIDDPHAVTYFD